MSIFREKSVFTKLRLSWGKRIMALKNKEGKDIQFFIYCTNFSGHYYFFEYFKKVNLVSLETHG